MSDPDPSTPFHGDFAHVDDSAYPHLYAQFLERFQQDPVIRSLKTQSYAALDVREGMRLLEVGCGLGDDVRAMAQMAGADGKVIGIDNSQTLLDDARQRSAGSDHGEEFQLGDMHHLPFADGSFDGCRAERVLLHSPEPASAVAEMARVLKPGGRIALLEPDLDTHILALDDLALARKWTQCRSDSTNNGTIGRHLPALLQQVGLGDIRIISAVQHAQRVYLPFLTRQVQRAQAHEMLTKAEGNALIEEVERRLAQHTYLQYTVFFLVAGRKPEL